MKNPQTRNTCPDCDALAAISSRPHCLTATCGWSVCTCGWTYDRAIDGAAFKQSKDRAEWKAAA
jgi:hypothetical protein